jgi:hypothetical protein
MSGSWGGARINSGPKPSGRPRRVHRAKADLVAHEGGLAGDPVEEEAVSAIPPEDLSADQRPFWHRNAAKAVAQGTLTARTLEAFLMLCELDAERRATKQTIDTQGRTYIKAWTDSSGQEHEELKAHPMVARYDRLSKQVENLLARFKLAPFGKAEATVKPKKMSNPWAALEKRG